MPRFRVTSRPIWLNGLPATRTRLISAVSAARSRCFSPTSPASPRSWRRSNPTSLGHFSMTIVTGMTDIVFAHDGTVAKIVGDALHVLFGAPGEQPDHAARAVNCALALDEYAQSFRERWHKKGVALGVTRIGVHAGPAIVGNFGGGRFFDYTAYGDTINIAARLEAANKQLGTRICVSAIARGKGKGLPRSSGGGPFAEGQVGGPARLRAPSGRAIRRSLDKELSRGVCQTGSRRSRCDGGLCRRMLGNTLMINSPAFTSSGC